MNQAADDTDVDRGRAALVWCLGVGSGPLWCVCCHRARLVSLPTRLDETVESNCDAPSIIAVKSAPARVNSARLLLGDWNLNSHSSSPVPGPPSLQCWSSIHVIEETATTPFGRPSRALIKSSYSYRMGRPVALLWWFPLYSPLSSPVQWRSPIRIKRVELRDKNTRLSRITATRSDRTTTG